MFYITNNNLMQGIFLTKHCQLINIVKRNAFSLKLVDAEHGNAEHGKKNLNQQSENQLCNLNADANLMKFYLAADFPKYEYFFFQKAKNLCPFNVSMGLHVNQRFLILHNIIPVQSNTKEYSLNSPAAVTQWVEF